ncbi:exodeoxyribonuclease V subunit gamma [Paraflavitalea soli]|uniref:RecBCD enzyme subunit RecC n=1 Tax=Paraflavitalea soli TaxID=2315862 RepID=A0A3B7N0P3_9BACT|nr:exodeoxyribonuclease V subunit gamma [Paraflavitalea soli]AXY77595.1 exodeoxyribonuclease V subunit gamma [Paraflavitalea soli]
MALYLKVSNSLDSLATGLADNLQEAGDSVFDPHYIVTQTDGMNNWLKLQIAHRLGITANCRFMKPNELVHQLYYLLGGKYTEMLSATNLSWLLFKLLGEKEFSSRFPSIADYFQHAGQEADTRRIALAEKVGDLFDQYQVYRPEIIRQWNEGASQDDADHTWQQYLWTRAKKEAGNALPDKTMVSTLILEKLKQPATQAQLKARLPRVQLFGLSIITAYHVQILFELSAIVDVHFYFINPSPLVYWFEDRSEKQLAGWRQKGYKNAEDSIIGNTLLTSWGRVIQDSFALFFQHDEFLNAYEDVGIVPPVPDSLLHKIQDDIFNAATTSRHQFTAADISDGSIQINACYTIAREVESLYNYLVYLVDKRKETLSPRDIVVMVSDIDSYAPYIKAVFNNAPYKIRYVIADESYNESDNIFTALRSILLLNEENFKAEAVLQLLDSSLIRKRFDITDVTRIRQVVDAANIRFGLTGRTEDDTHLVSWEYGIKRIMFGICMSGEMVYSDGADSFYPLDMLEGSEALEIIRFCHFADILMDTIRQRRTPRAIAGWVEYVEYLLHNLVLEPAEDTDEDYHTLMKHLADYNLLYEYMTEDISFEVFGHNFLQILSGTTRSGLFANGGITFCSLIPMRSIPFKVVALMGLDYDKFPRREQPASFNLITRQRQRGDRNVKENDKHLFLETVQSAREYLYISYRGQNAKDNSTLPPSALIDELLDYIEAGAEAPETVRPQLVTLQPLQSFSHQYALGNKRLYSYLDTVGATGKKVIQANKPTDPLNFEEIMLDDLVRFFKNPFKVYYNKVLGIYYGDEQVLLGDTELFSLDKLQQWELKNRLLTTRDTNTMRRKLAMTGKLPLKNMALVAVKQVEDVVMQVRAMYDACTQLAEPQSVTVVVPIGDSVLKGTIQDVFDKKLVQVSWSRHETKYLAETYIRYLAGIAAGELTGAHFISGAKKEAAYAAIPLSKAAAIQRLTALIAIYKAGFAALTPFYPDFDIKPGQVAELDYEKFSKLVAKKLDMSDDPYIVPEYKKGFYDREVVLEQYKAVAAHILVPLDEIFPGYYD